MKSQSLFIPGNSVAKLGIIAMEGAKELGAEIDQYLVNWAKESGMEVPGDTFLVEASCPRFSSGDAKGLIKSTVRGMDLYIVVDPGNYSCTYDYFGHQNCMSPDDHYQDLKRLIQAASGKAHRVNVVMPMLYGGRQHRRSYRESLDCAYALQELQSMGVENVLTFDAHDPRVANAVPLMGLDNLMPYYQVLKKMFKDFPDMKTDREHFMIVSPDEGAMNRNMFYASVMGVDLGMFYKRRDYSRMVNGKNPIVAHEYLGASVEGKTIFVADDIISSGESMLDAARRMKERGATKFFCFATFALFTNGLASFDKAYEEGVIDGVFGTNLTYCPDELKNRPWFHQVDVAKYAAYYISALNHEVSIATMIDPHARVEALLAKKRAGENA
ncbi:MAG: ribose-phosphate pyrophosphokinase [Clostridia bacterium]|nr:ribose-phosphate pyrophosphokinase [Clostridia bacterium]